MIYHCIICTDNEFEHYQTASTTANIKEYRTVIGHPTPLIDCGQMEGNLGNLAL